MIAFPLTILTVFVSHLSCAFLAYLESHLLPKISNLFFFYLNVCPLFSALVECDFFNHILFRYPHFFEEPYPRHPALPHHFSMTINP